MKLSRNRIILIIAGLILAYFAVPFPFLSDAGRDDARESAIRWLLRHHSLAIQKGYQVCFVVIGTQFDPHEDNGCHMEDPTKKFVDRLSDFPVPVFPASQGVPRKLSGVMDKQGRPGVIFGAGNVKRWSLGIAVCRGYFYEGGLSAGGYDIYMLHLPFLWIPVGGRNLWAS